jgi:hypothetical protein
MLSEEKANQPAGESLSDYEAVGEVAKKTGLFANKKRSALPSHF